MVLDLVHGRAVAFLKDANVPVPFETIYLNHMFFDGRS